MFRLEHSRSPLSSVKVTVDDVPVAADSPGGGWSTAGDTVTFKGALSEQVSNSTLLEPVKVEFETSQNQSAARVAVHAAAHEVLVFLEKAPGDLVQREVIANMSEHERIGEIDQR